MGEVDTIHVKKNNSVILDIYMNSLRNSVAHHFTPHHTITTSYRYSGIGITKSYSMITGRDEVPSIFWGLGYRRRSGRGWDILYNINVWRWGNWVIIKRWSGGRGVYYPHSPPNNVPRGTFSTILYIIRYEPTPHRSIIPIYIRYEFRFVGLGGV